MSAKCAPVQCWTSMSLQDSAVLLPFVEYSIAQGRLHLLPRLVTVVETIDSITVFHYQDPNDSLFPLCN